MNILELIDQSIETKQKLKAEISTIEKIAKAVISAYKRGNKVILCGNGGSAADAQHIACEFVGGLSKDRRPLAAIALTTNSSIITAIANDMSFDEIFDRQIQAIGHKGDILIAISTSGNSPNVIKAVEKAKLMGIYTVGLTGATGDKLSGITDIAIKVPSTNTQRIQESHILIGHIICEIVESNY